MPPAAVIFCRAAPEKACAVTVSAALVCWGRYDFGDKGSANMAYSLIPIDVHGLSCEALRERF